MSLVFYLPIYIKDIEVSYFCNLKLGYRIFFNHCLSSLILIRIARTFAYVMNTPD